MIDNRSNQYSDSIDNHLTIENENLKQILSKRSVQIGDLKNKLIKAQQEVIALNKRLLQNNKFDIYILNTASDYINSRDKIDAFDQKVLDRINELATLNKIYQ
jgi:hypothetical protein